MKRITKLFLLAIICLFTICGESMAARPFRVLVMIGDQWKDPESYMVKKTAPTGEYSGYFMYPEVYGDNDFHKLMVLLKSWGIPFDVVRLDQQFLDPNMFMGMDGRPKYGTIIWDVNQSEDLLHPDYSIVKRMVEEEGIGLIALSDRISQPGIQDLLGLKYRVRISWNSNRPPGSFPIQTARPPEGCVFAVTWGQPPCVTSTSAPGTPPAPATTSTFCRFM